MRYILVDNLYLQIITVPKDLGPRSVFRSGSGWHKNHGPDHSSGTVFGRFGCIVENVLSRDDPNRLQDIRTCKWYGIDRSLS